MSSPVPSTTPSRSAPLGVETVTLLASLQTRPVWSQPAGTVSEIVLAPSWVASDRKGRRLDSSHPATSYAVSCVRQEPVLVKSESVAEETGPVACLEVAAVFWLFFFEEVVAPRELHSFPTRRSSDLVETVTLLASLQTRPVWSQPAGTVSEIVLAPSWVA